MYSEYCTKEYVEMMEELNKQQVEVISDLYQDEEDNFDESCILTEEEIEELLNVTSSDAQAYLDSMPDISDEEAEYLLSLI
jgi:DNA-binding MarR family transcriptional regulator